MFCKLQASYQGGRSAINPIIIYLRRWELRTGLAWVWVWVWGFLQSIVD